MTEDELLGRIQRALPAGWFASLLRVKRKKNHSGDSWVVSIEEREAE